MSIKQLSQQEAYDRYEFAGLLGEGAYGFVYAGVDKSNGERVAIKTMTFAKCEFNAIVAEIDLLFKLRSPYVVSIVEALQFDNQIWIVMECCEGGALNDIMKAVRSPLTEAQAKEVIAYSLLALKHCHSYDIIHRDLKAANLLLHRDGCVKLADFGNSATLSSIKKKRNTMVGTAQFISPEMAKGQSYDNLLDVWALGITLYELCEGHPPYANKGDLKVIALVASKASPTLKNPSLWSKDCQQFLALCLEQNVAKRPSVEALMKHTWVKTCFKSIVGSSGTRVLKEYFDSSIGPIMALRREQDDSSDESDNEHDMKDILAEEEEARVRGEEEAARLHIEAQEATRLLVEKQAATRILIEKQAAAKLREEVQEEAIRRKSQRDLAEKLKLEEEAALHQAEEEEATARFAAERAAALVVGSDNDDGTLTSPVPCIPSCFQMLAKKQNNSAFKMSNWKGAYFVLDGGMLSYFRSKADYLHNKALKEDTSAKISIKKENRYDLSTHCTANLHPTVGAPHVVAVSDSSGAGGGWSVLVKCENEASCNAWVSNVEKQVKYLQACEDYKTVQKTGPVSTISGVNVSEVKPSLGKTATTAANVNKFINKLRESERDQQKVALTRLNKRLTMRKGRADSMLMPTEMNGWAHKKTDHSHNWKRRHFVLENATLKYFLTDKNTVPQGIFIFTPLSTVIKGDGNVITVTHVIGTHDGGKSQLASSALAIKVDDDDLVIETWALALQDNINHSKHVKLPENLERMKGHHKYDE